jgi:NADPH2:quinone reductase
MKAVVIDKTIDPTGGPRVLTVQERPTPEPSRGEVLVDVRVAGVNFFDTAIRRHALAEVPGTEGFGVVLEAGEGVEDFVPGDRVAWLAIDTQGSYAEQNLVPVGDVVAVPDAVDDETAGALLAQGISAHHFATVCHPTQAGDVVLVHAAAGGVGMLITQIVKARGGKVIGLVSRPEKVDSAAEAGADHVLVSSGAGFVEEVTALTRGEGVHAVFDGGGAATFEASLKVLRTHGSLVFYGPLIPGGVPTIAMSDIPRSARLTYGRVEDHMRTPEEFRSRADELFRLVEKDELQVRIGGRYALADAAQAHADIESRSTTGKLLLVP